MWETTLDNIVELRLTNEKTIGSELRTRLIVTTTDGETTTLSASAPKRICELIAQQYPQLDVSDTTGDQAVEGGARHQKEKHAWYLETRAQNPIWRGGTVRFDGQKLQWQAPTDARPAVNLRLAELTGVDTLHMTTPAGRGLVLHVVTKRGSIHLAVANAEQWRQVLAAQISYEESHVRNW